MGIEDHLRANSALFLFCHAVIIPGSQLTLYLCMSKHKKSRNVFNVVS